MPGRRSQEDFGEEIRAHLALEAERLRGLGMSETEAAFAARRRFGNVGSAEDRFYHGRRFARVDDMVRDLRHALRALGRSRGFLLTAVGTLALAIGAVAGMFDVVNTVVLRALPYPNPERLVVLSGTAPGTDLPDRFDLGPQYYVHLKEKSQLLDGLFTFSSGTSTLRVGDRAERVEMGWTTADMYSTLGATPQLGRLPRAEDHDDVVMLSDQLWSTWFGRDSSVIGKWFFVSDSMKQVIGVMPRGFSFPEDDTMLWPVIEIREADLRDGELGGPLIGRMKEGVTTEELDAELKQLATQLPGRFGGPPNFQRIIDRYQPVTEGLHDAVVGPVLRTSLFLLLGGVGIVLLVACANVANLFMVRAETRRRDLAVRRAIGASRAQLVRFQMAEAVVVALIAGILAIMLTWITLPMFVRAAPSEIPRLAEVAGVDGATLGAAFILVVFVALVCGLVPALRASTPDLSGLREGGRGQVGGRRWGRDVLVVAQTALALVLLIGSALLLQSFRRLRQVDPGYEIADRYTFQFAPEQPQWRDGPSLGQLHLTVMERLRALPGVTDVGVVNNLPLDEGTSVTRVRPDGAGDTGEGVRLSLNFTGGDYFRTMGIRLLSGRDFTGSEAVTPNNSVIISQSAATRLWPGQDPLGRSVRPQLGRVDTVTYTVVGVVNDVKQDDWRIDGEAVLYLPLTGPTPDAWRMGSPAYVVKSTRAETLREDVRRIVHEIAPEAPVYREYTLAFLARRSMLQLSFTTLTLGVLASLALVLGAVGLYGVLSYVVAQRSREIGVRMALGATAGAVRRQVVSEGTRVVLIGAGIGMGAALLSTRLLASLLFDVRAVDPIVFGAMGAVLVMTGALASYMPARRASSVDPTQALRSD
ncbi:MAG: ABC transporter permease [Gemmatimonadetes bacterium]|nr:ABC transporter permease [Gemmatimonadota bacterium]